MSACPSRWQQIFALPEENVLTCWESAPVCGRILKPLKCDLCYDLRLRLRAQQRHVEWRVGAPWWLKAAAHIILKLESVLLLEREKAESWVVESKWRSDSGVGKGEKFKISCWNFSPKFSFCFKFQPQKTEKMRTRPQGEERGRRGAALGSDVWTEEEEEELWCRSAAQIRLSHKSLELPRDGQPTASLSVCLSVWTNWRWRERAKSLQRESNRSSRRSRNQKKWRHSSRRRAESAHSALKLLQTCLISGFWILKSCSSALSRRSWTDRNPQSAHPGKVFNLKTTSAGFLWLFLRIRDVEMEARRLVTFRFLKEWQRGKDGSERGRMKEGETFLTSTWLQPESEPPESRSWSSFSWMEKRVKQITDAECARVDFSESKTDSEQAESDWFKNKHSYFKIKRKKRRKNLMRVENELNKPWPAYRCAVTYLCRHAAEPTSQHSAQPPCSSCSLLLQSVQHHEVLLPPQHATTWQPQCHLQDRWVHCSFCVFV